MMKLYLGVPLNVKLTQGMLDEYCRRTNRIYVPDYVSDVPAEYAKALTGTPEGNIRMEMQKKQIIEYVQNAVKGNNATTKTTSSVEALKKASVNNDEFNAYTYYSNNADLQTAIGANPQKLYEHWITYGKAEGRKAK